MISGQGYMVLFPLVQMADLLHGAVGSTAVVGLTRLSMQLKDAEDAARTDDHAAMAENHAKIGRRLAEEKES